MEKLCKKCGKKFDQPTELFFYCADCNDQLWAKLKKKEKKNIEKINELVRKGHSRHCACRQVWGDGECECDLYDKGYDPYAWMKRNTTT